MIQVFGEGGDIFLLFLERSLMILGKSLGYHHRTHNTLLITTVYCRSASCYRNSRHFLNVGFISPVGDTPQVD